MPSTRMRSSFAWSVISAPSSLAELPLARDHRRDDALTGHDVLADRGVDMHGHEHHQRPHAEVMIGVHVLAVRPDRKHPSEQFVLPAIDAGALRIKRKA